MPSAPARSADLSQLDREHRAVPGGGDDRDSCGGLLTAAATTCSTSARCEGEELAGAAGGEQPGASY